MGTAIEAVLREVSKLFCATLAACHPAVTTKTLPYALDHAIAVAAGQPAIREVPALMARVGMRCQFFPRAYSSGDAVR